MIEQIKSKLNELGYQEVKQTGGNSETEFFFTAKEPNGEQVELKAMMVSENHYEIYEKQQGQDNFQKKYFF